MWALGLWLHYVIHTFAYSKLKAFGKVSQVKWFIKGKAGCYFPLEHTSCDISSNSNLYSNEKSEAGINTEGSEYSTSCSIVTYWHGNNHFFISTVLFYIDRKWKDKFSVLNTTGYSSSTNFYGTWQRRMAKQTWARKRIYWRSYQDRVSSQTATRWVVIFNPFF